jgi:hypothetical protein
VQYVKKNSIRGAEKTTVDGDKSTDEMKGFQAKNKSK